MFGFSKKTKKDNEKIAAIIVAAGQSTRMNNQNKQFAELLGKPVLAYSLEAFENSPSVGKIYIVCRENDILLVSDIVAKYDIKKAVSIMPGGLTRQQSVKAGLDEADGCDIIAIHDGARPCILTEHIEAAVSMAYEYGAAAVGIPAIDTLKRVDENRVITGTVDRKGIWQIQTPQVFRAEVIHSAHENAIKNGIEGTDDCALVEAMGVDVHMVEGAISNIKITTPEDIYVASGIILQRGEVLL